MEPHNIIMAFGLTLFAGLATGIGSSLAFFAKRTNTKFLSVSLGFSAGVMIYVSFVEMFFQAREDLILELGKRGGTTVTIIAFFLGILLIGIIDKFVPSFENPHEIRDIEEFSNIDEDSINSQGKNKSLLRMGYMSAIAITIHNFPEGLATFAASINDISIGLPIAVAIAIHNIPEGIAVSIPLYYSTGSRKKAFFYSFISGLSEPLGALVGYLLLIRFFNDLTLGIIFAAVAGIMIYISLDELLPASEKYGEHHLSIYGLILGMLVMAVSLLMFI